MKVQMLTDDLALRETFARLCLSYRQLEAAVAWCGSPGNGIPYDLMGPIARRTTALVGIDFDHTHPDGLARLRELGVRVRIVDKCDGIFHPKVYLFSRPGRSALLVGSANLTPSAFFDNREAAILLEGSPKEMRSTVSSVRKSLAEWHELSTPIRMKWLNDYRKQYKWARGPFKGSRRRLSPALRDERSTTPLTFMRKASWPEYYRRVRRALDSPYGGRTVEQSRDVVLDAARRLLPRTLSLRMLDQQEVRSLLIGRGPRYCYALFGYVGAKGSGLPKLLAHGSDSKRQKVVDAFNAVRAMERHVDYGQLAAACKKLCSLGPTMKVWGRIMLLADPSLYLSVSNDSLRRQLSEQLGIAQYRFGEPDGYVEAVRRLHATPWFGASKPSRPQEQKVWDNRMAYIDVLYYED